MSILTNFVTVTEDPESLGPEAVHRVCGGTEPGEPEALTPGTRTLR